jgi:membrane-associated phospholipid phosphatase
VPIGGVAAGLMVTDRDTSFYLSNSPKKLRNYREFSNCGAAGMADVAGSLYLWGRASGDPHKQEAGILSGEAAVDAPLVSTALKFVTGRERPTKDSARGKFWQGGDSFPSDHAAGAWAVASLLAHEYPGPFTRIFVYGAATAISVSRIQGKQHFPSDVLVGSGIGWLTGWQVY